MKKFKKLLILSFSVITTLTTPIFAQSELNTINNNVSISPFIASHDYKNFKVSNGTNFQVSITLTSSQPYGKAHYYNSSAYDVTLYVEGQGTVTVKPYSSNYIQWKKGSFKNTYDVALTATKGTLNGTFSLAKAERTSDFQN